MFCIAKNCRYATTHNIENHKCGTCGKFGHGAMECEARLKHTRAPEPEFVHYVDNELDIIIKYIQSLMKDTKGKIYVEILGGMGSAHFARRQDVDKSIELFTLHSDDYGQYGTTYLNKLDKFIAGYTKIN